MLKQNIIFGVGLEIAKLDPKGNREYLLKKKNLIMKTNEQNQSLETLNIILSY